jgi:hypothetical protein
MKHDLEYIFNMTENDVQNLMIPIERILLSPSHYASRFGMCD